MSKVFTLNVVGARWHAHCGQIMGTIPQSLVQQLAGEIQSWYNDLDEHVQQHVREVTVWPGGGSPRSLSEVSLIHVSIQTVGLIHSDVADIPPRTVGFLCDPATDLVHDQGGGCILRQSLNRTLSNMLERQIDWLTSVIYPAQEAVNILSIPSYPDTQT